MNNKANVFNKSHPSISYGRCGGASLIAILLIVLGMAALFTGWNYLLDVLFPVHFLPKANEISLTENFDGKGPLSTSNIALKSKAGSVNRQDYSRSDREKNRIATKKKINEYSTGEKSVTLDSVVSSLKNKQKNQSKALLKSTGSVNLARTKLNTTKSYSNKSTHDNEESYNAIDDEENGELPYGDFSISGQLLNEGGEGVSNVALTANIVRLFDSSQDNLNLQGKFRIFTGDTGGFIFQNLAEGEYMIRTTVSDLYPVETNTVSRTGVDSIKLVIQEQRDILLSGLIEESFGGTVGQVEITPLNHPDQTVFSDYNGQYNLAITMKGRSDYSIRYRAEGYQEQTIRISSKESFGVDQIQRNVYLEPNKQMTVVSGKLISNNSPVIGERVYLKSSSTRKKYNSVTDNKGDFVLEGVEVGNDYILWVSPQGAYKMYRKNNLNIPIDGLNNLNIALQTEGVGSLVGRMVDLEGHSVPNLSLTVRSEGSSSNQILTSDEAGNFKLDNIPEGRLRISTASLPKLGVSGIELPAGEKKEVVLIIDIGEYRMQGQVTDSQGNPLPAANIILTWVNRENGITYESLHKSVSTADGRFQINQLGPGKRTVTVAVPGYQTVKLPYEARGGFDDDLNIELIASTPPT